MSESTFVKAGKKGNWFVIFFSKQRCVWPCGCELKATSHFKIYSAAVNNIYNGRYGDEKGSYLCSESVWVQGLAVNI